MSRFEYEVNLMYNLIVNINRALELRLTYSPISLFKWQMYESQRMRQKWFAVLGDDAQQTDEEQDVMKVKTSINYINYKSSRSGH